MNFLRYITGLPLSPYFAGTKVRCLIDNIPKLRADIDNTDTRDNVHFGTVDTWIVYQLNNNIVGSEENDNVTMNSISSTGVAGYSANLGGGCTLPTSPTPTDGCS